MSSTRAQRAQQIWWIAGLGCITSACLALACLGVLAAAAGAAVYLGSSWMSEFDDWDPLDEPWVEVAVPEAVVAIDRYLDQVG